MAEWERRNAPPEDHPDFDAWAEEHDLHVLEIFDGGQGLTGWDPSSLPRAKNVIDWVTNPIFLGRTTLYDYPRQYQILRDTYELLCPYCNDIGKVVDCWNRTPEDMRSDILLEYGVCPGCGRTRLDLIEEGYIEEVVEVILILGMRSGKTTMVGTYDQTYIAHRYLCMQDPTGHFGLDRSTTLESGFFAASREQTEQTIWGGFQSTLLSTDWYHRYITTLKEFCDAKALHWDDVYRCLKTRVTVVPHRVQFASYHSNPATTAGRTRFSATVDEMGMFMRSGGEEIHNIPKASLQTLFAATAMCRNRGEVDVPPVRLTEIGSPGPIPEIDPLECRFQAVNQSAVRGVYTLRLPTWEANKYITRESLESDFQTDPVKAERQWGARALPASVRFFAAHQLDSAFVPTESPGVLWSQNVRRQTTNDGAEVYYVEAIVTQIRLQASDGPLIIIGDAGKSRDRFALSIGRVIGKGSEMITRVESLIQIVPGIVQVAGNNKVQTEVYYPCVLPIIEALHKTCKVELVLFDRWDSTYVVQKCRDLGIPAMQQNTQEEDYMLARGEFRAGRVQIPARCPVDMAIAYTALRSEIEDLRQAPSGKVDHPVGQHNDVAQVLCQTISTALAMPQRLKSARKVSGITVGPLAMSPARVASFSPYTGMGPMRLGAGSNIVPGEIPKSVSRLYSPSGRRRR